MDEVQYQSVVMQPGDRIRLLRGSVENQPPAPTSLVKELHPRRFEELDGYRGLAALLVVVYHACKPALDASIKKTWYSDNNPVHFFVRNLDASVDCFFVLSGFLVFLPFADAALEQRKGLSVRGFLVRRAIRILPVYYVTLILVWTWKYTGEPVQRLNLLLSLSFTQIFDTRHLHMTLPPAWSLSNEVIFYLFLAFLGPLCYKMAAHLTTLRARTAFLLGCVSLLVGFSIAFKLWAVIIAHIPGSNHAVYWGPLARLDTFAIGMFLAVAVAVVSGRTHISKTMSRLLWGSGFALAILTCLFRSRSDFFFVYFHTLIALAFALILASTVLGMRGSAWEWAFAHPSLQFLGLISYSLYLWHEPIRDELIQRDLLMRATPSAFWSNTLVLLIVSIPAAAVSYWVIERPAMELRRLFTREGRLRRSTFS